MPTSGGPRSAVPPGMNTRAKVVAHRRRGKAFTEAPNCGPIVGEARERIGASPTPERSGLPGHRPFRAVIFENVLWHNGPRHGPHMRPLGCRGERSCIPEHEPLELSTHLGYRELLANTDLGYEDPPPRQNVLTSPSSARPAKRPLSWPSAGEAAIRTARNGSAARARRASPSRRPRSAPRAAS